MSKAKLIEDTEMMLTLVLDGCEVPSLANLDKYALEKICKWAATCHYEASDNPIRARCAPKCLRDLLPQSHYLQAWRMPKRKAAR